MSKFTILAMFAILTGIGFLSTAEFNVLTSALAQSMMDNATMAGNMTGGNMTMGGAGNTTSNLTAASEEVGSISGCRRC